MNSTKTPSSFLFQHSGQQLSLLADKAVYWHEQKALLLSDLHLGKAGHFRKSGIPIPSQVHRHDLQRLRLLLESTQAQKVLFLGDLFHSELNNEWWDFTSWMDGYPDKEFVLVKGNHDILPPAAYESDKLEIIEKELAISPFLLTHEPLDHKYHKGDLYNISGHVHPAVSLKGAAFQQITLPCFYFGLHYALLPAFGKFTGFHKIQPKAKEAVFAIAGSRVIRV